jgi:DNA-binding transcriptional LysR family regulator
MLPSPQEIAGFIEIAKTLNITKAAHQLGITQPTLSQSLRKLEHTIGETLVIRSKNGVELTIAGKEFLKHARFLTNYWDDVKLKTKNSTNEVRGNAKIGCHPSVGLYTLDHFLPQLIKNHPHLEITLIHDLSRKICNQIINFEVDIGLVINPIQHPDLVLKKIFSDEVKVWRTESTTPDVLICHTDLAQTQDILKKLKTKKQSFDRLITTNSLEIITRLTLSGAGHGIIPSRVVSIFDREKKLKALVNSPIFRDELYVVHRHENTNIEFIKAIKSEILRTLQG